MQKATSNLSKHIRKDNIINIIKYAYSYCTNTGKCPIRFALIEVTEKCNLKCIMCPIGKQIKRKTEMNYTQFKKIINELCDCGLKSVTIGSIGEPTLNKNLPEMLKYIQQKKIKTELITNLSLPLSKELIESVQGLDRLTVSIDGATKEVYEKIRVGANFKRTITNLRKIASLKKKNQFITINYVIQKENYFEIPKMIKLLGTIENINKLSTGFAHLPVKNLSNRIHLNTKELEEFKNIIIPQCKKAKEKHTIITNYILNPDHWKENDICSAQKISKSEIKKINSMPCYLLWTSTFISPDGTVHPCCTFFAEKEYILGNAKKQKIKEIWNGKKYNKIRKKFKKEKHPLCRYCTGTGPNEKMHNMRHILK